MKIKINGLCLFVSTLLFTVPLYAQSAFVSSGGTDSGNGGTVSSSIGQVYYMAKTDASGSVSEGVQHAYEIYLVSNEDEVLNPKFTLKFKTYPNPVSHELFLEYMGPDILTSTFYFQLIDASGRIIKMENLVDNTTRIDMNNLVSATYFIKIISNTDHIATYKVVKFR